MELVYLWVEEYKNIKEQGFNFSPRFKCDYNPDTKELTIDENDDYVSIFPENINITVIVGENGSGKSSLLEIINHYEYSFFLYICKQRIFIYNRNDEILMPIIKIKNLILKNNNFKIKSISEKNYLIAKHKELKYTFFIVMICTMLIKSYIVQIFLLIQISLLQCMKKFLYLMKLMNN